MTAGVAGPGPGPDGGVAWRRRRERTQERSRRPRSWTLRSRLSALFVVAVVAVAAVTAVAIVNFVHLTDTRHTLFNKIDPASLEADQLLQAYLDEETGIRGYLLTQDAAFLQPYLDGAASQRSASAKLHASITGHPHLQQLTAAAEQAASSWGSDFALPTVRATSSGNTAYAESQLLGPGKTRFDLVRARFDALESALSSERSATGNELSTATDELITSLVVALLLVVAAGLLLARALRRWVVEPVSALGDSVRQVADGQLERAIEPSGPPELAELGADVEAMRLRIVSELGAVSSARADLAERNLDLMRSNEELEQFAYVASHDLQEPLRKVTSFVQLLQQRYQGRLDDRADDYIGFAVDGAKRMQELINDLLEFSRVGRGTDGFRSVDTGAAAREAVSSLARLVDEASASVRIGPLPTVDGDRALLTSLFQNLIGNAVKFRGDSAPVVSVTAGRRDGAWEFAVADNGIGIEPRFADRVFVIFQRLHGRDAYDGTGIGLALCRKIVDHHGGTIWVDTEYTGGARLCFTLPDDQEGRAACEPDKTEPPSSS